MKSTHRFLACLLNQSRCSTYSFSGGDGCPAGWAISGRRNDKAIQKGDYRAGQRRRRRKGGLGRGSPVPIAERVRTFGQLGLAVCAPRLSLLYIIYDYCAHSIILYYRSVCVRLTATPWKRGPFGTIWCPPKSFFGAAPRSGLVFATAELDDELPPQKLCGSMRDNDLSQMTG